MLFQILHLSVLSIIPWFHDIKLGGGIAPMAPSSYEPATKITLQFILLLICFRIFGDSQKILWNPQKFWAVPFPDVFLKLLKCLAPSPSPNFGGFWGFSPENPRYMDCPHPRSFPRAFKWCIPVPTPSPRGRGIPGDYRGSIPRIPSIVVISQLVEQ